MNLILIEPAQSKYNSIAIQADLYVMFLSFSQVLRNLPVLKHIYLII